MGMYVMFPKFLHAAASNAGHGGISVSVGLVFRKLLRNFVSGGIKLLRL